MDSMGIVEVEINTNFYVRSFQIWVFNNLYIFIKKTYL